MAQIGSLSVKLGLVTVDWDKATDKAKAQAKDLQAAFNNLGGGLKTLSQHFKNFGTLGGALGFSALYAETAALTDEVDDLSKSYGLSTSQILLFRGALRDAGGEADSASKIISTLFGKIDDAKSGNDAVIGQFEKLGITFQDLKRMTPYDAIVRVADGFKNITDQFEKTKAIKEFFGKGGIGLSMDAISDALHKSTSEFDSYAASIKTVGQVSDAVKANMENLKIAFAEVIAPFTSSGVLSIKQFELILQGLGSAALIMGISSVAAQIMNVVSAIRAATAAGAAFNLMAGGMTPIGIILKAVGVAGAIGAYLYVSSDSTSNTQMPSTAGTDASAEIANAPANAAAARAAAMPLPERGISSEAANAARGAFAANDPRIVGSGVSKEAAAKQLSLTLTKQLMAIDSARARINLDIEGKEELSNQLAIIQLDTKEKTLQIEAKLAQELESMRESGSQAMKDATIAAAVAEKQRVAAQGASAAAMAREQDRLAQKKRSFDTEAEYLRSLGAMGADNEQETVGQLREAEDARTHARLAFTNQIKDSERLNELASERLKYENSLADKLPEERAGLLMEYDLEAKINDFKRQALSMGLTKAQTDAYAELIRSTGKAANDVAKTAAQLGLSSQVKDAMRLNDLANARLEYEGRLLNLTTEQRNVLMAEYDLEAKILDYKRQAKALGTSQADIDATAAAMKATGAATASIIKQNRDAQRTFSAGWDKAFNEYADNATNAALRGEEAFKSMTDTFTSAIDQFVETGTVAWDKLIENMIKGMLKAEMQRQTTQLFSMGINFLMGSFGSSPIPMQPGGGYAAGGDPPVGVPSLVGERGPEIFVPKVAGTIIPNDFLKKKAGAAAPTLSMADSTSSAPTVNYNGPYIASMSAIDTQSGVQFLAKNKQAVWATYQSANRSVPMSR